MILTQKKFILIVSLSSILFTLVLYSIYNFESKSNIASVIIGVNTSSCAGEIDVTTFVDAKGFTNITKIYKGTLPFYDFTLKPDGKGTIVMDYKFAPRNICSDNKCRQTNSTQDVMTYDSPPFTTFDKFFNRTLEIQKVNSTYPLVPYVSKDIQLTMKAENLTSSIVRITYDIRTSPGTEKGNYLLDLINMCPGQLLTVGDKSYIGPLPWDNGRIA